MILLSLACLTSDPPPASTEPATPPVDPAPDAPRVLGWVANGSVTAVSIKNGTAEVPGTLSVGGSLTFEDTVTLSGVSGTLTADVSTWNSELELRDQRIRDTFFEVADHAQASFEATSFTVTDDKGTLEGALTMHGASKDVSIAVDVLKGDNGVALRSTEPVTLLISEFGMTPQLDALVALCGHDSVDDAVQLTVDLKLGVAPEWPAAAE
jgi:polyisoprenoid-binding protein YceI